MKQITLEIPEALWTHLRLTSIHNGKDTSTIILDIVKNHYEGRKND